MKHLIWCFVLMAGCCTLHEDYVRKDRKNYETLAPRIRAMMAETNVYTEDQVNDIDDRLNAWDARTAEGMKQFEKEAQ